MLYRLLGVQLVQLIQAAFLDCGEGRDVEGDLYKKDITSQSAENDKRGKTPTFLKQAWLSSSFTRRGVRRNPEITPISGGTP